jgi:predicted RNase H-like HicB family nuclease
MKAFVIKKMSAAGWSAYSPDLPGLRAEAKTLDEVKKVT